MNSTVSSHPTSASRPVSTSSSEPVKMKPKEHGAYAILGIPIVTSFVMAGTTWPGVCIAVAAVSGFLAHEPLLVTLGRRGARAQRTTPAAKQHLAILLGVSVFAGSLAFVLGSNLARFWLAVCLVLAVTSFAIAIAGKHRTLGGQLFAVVGLSVPCMPILISGSDSIGMAHSVWMAWLIGFTSTTMAVRGVIASQKRQPRILHWTFLAGLVGTVAGLEWSGDRHAIATLPMLAMSVYLMIWPPPARQLKRVGWTLVVGTVASALWMIVVS